MTQFKTFTPQEREALKLHGLDTFAPSQLSDAFVLGLRYAKTVCQACNGKGTLDLLGDGVQRPCPLHKST